MYGLVWCFLVIVLICWGDCLGRFGCVNRLFIDWLSLGLGLLCCVCFAYWFVFVHVIGLI